MIECEQLTKYYAGRTVLDHICLTVQAGEIVALMGGNGAGKSTTLNILLGLVRPDGGSVTISGHDATRESNRTRTLVSYLPDILSIYPRFTAAENVQYFASLAGLRLSDESIKDHLQRAGLDQVHHRRRTGSFSKGMRQKVGLAIAFSRKSPVLLLDEPMSGLDPASADSLCQCLREEAERGAAILMATHDVFRAHQTAHRVAVLHEGILRGVYDPRECSIVALAESL